MMEVTLYNSKEDNLYCKFLLIAMYALNFAIYAFPEASTILCALLGIVMILTMFTDVYYVSAIVAVIGNESLGGVFAGRLTFYFFAMALLIVRYIFMQRGRMEAISIKKRTGALLLCLVFYFVHYYLFQQEMVSLAYTLYMTLALMFAYWSIEDDDEKVRHFFTHIALCIFISVLHCVIYGGVEYYEATEALGVARTGIYGAGAGDPVFSGFLILISVAIFLTDRVIPAPARYIMIAVDCLALTKMVSTTALIGLIMVVVVYFLCTKKMHKSIFWICIIIIAITVGYHIYIGLPDNMQNAELNALLDKSFLKYTQFVTGNLSDATTYRSDISSQYLEYFTSQGAIGYFFGGNKIPVSGIKIGGYNMVAHNTYIDWLLRYGLLGTGVIIFYIVKRTLRCYQELRLDREKNATSFLLKILFVFYIYSLSVYRGVFFPLLFLVLIVL